MYIRWKSYQRIGKYGKGESLYCVLVTSERVNGKPRQRFIAHLGLLDGTDALSRRLLWRDVDKKLSTLDLRDDERQHIEAQIARRVERA